MSFITNNSVGSFYIHAEDNLSDHRLKSPLKRKKIDIYPNDEGLTLNNIPRKRTKIEFIRADEPQIIKPKHCASLCFNSALASNDFPDNLDPLSGAQAKLIVNTQSF